MSPSGVAVVVKNFTAPPWIVRFSRKAAHRGRRSVGRRTSGSFSSSRKLAALRKCLFIERNKKYTATPSARTTRNPSPPLGFFVGLAANAGSRSIGTIGVAHVVTRFVMRGPLPVCRRINRPPEGWWEQANGRARNPRSARLRLRDRGEQRTTSRSGRPGWHGRAGRRRGPKSTQRTQSVSSPADHLRSSGQGAPRTVTADRGRPQRGARPAPGRGETCG